MIRNRSHLTLGGIPTKKRRCQDGGDSGKAKKDRLDGVCKMSLAASVLTSRSPALSAGKDNRHRAETALTLLLPLPLLQVGGICEGRKVPLGGGPAREATDHHRAADRMVQRIAHLRATRPTSPQHQQAGEVVSKNKQGRRAGSASHRIPRIKC